MVSVPKWALSVSNILFRKNLEFFTHFEMYNSDPNKDCSSFLVHLVLFFQDSHILEIFSNFSNGTDTVKFSVLISTPKQIDCFCGWLY